MYLESLVAFLRAHRSELCAECQERTEKNPLRVFDCKNPACQAVLAGAPAITDALSDEARAHFEAVQRQLAVLGIPFRVNPRMVRGHRLLHAHGVRVRLRGPGAGHGLARSAAAAGTTGW